MKSLFFLLSLMLSASAFSQTGYARSVGVDIAYRTFGKGEPLLIINGGPGMNSEGFAALAEELSGDYMTVIFDQRGTGKSSLPAVNRSTVTMDLMVEDIEALRKTLKIESWSILGHSFGGMLGSLYTSKYPSRVDKLVLSSSGGLDLELLSYVGKNITQKLTPAEQQQLDHWNNKISNGDTSHHARLQRGMALAAAYVFNRKYIPQIALRLTQSNFAINNLVWNDMQLTRFDCTAKAKAFRKPVLIIQGRQDIIEERTAIKAAKAFPAARIVLLDNCVHYGWMDARDEYFKEVRKFLAE